MTNYERQLQKAALSGGQQQLMALANYLLEQEDYERAIQWLEEGVKLGYAEAMYVLGNCYYAEIGVDENIGRAFELYEMASKLKHPDAINNLADMYLNGEYVEVNEEQALRLFELAAQLGVAEAMFTLGMMFEQGIGIKPNNEQAYTYYKQSAEAGDSEAQNRMATIYFEGLLQVELNVAKAIDWYKRAAMQHHIDAIYSLGYIYNEGVGVMRNMKAAISYFEQAAQLGDIDAAKQLVEILTGNGRKDEAQYWQRKIEEWFN